MAEGTTSPKSELAVWATSKNGPAVPPFVPPAQVGTGALGEFIMSQPTEEQIRKRAFELWEQAGKPEGREDEFWNQAQRELQGAEGRGDPLTKVPTFNSVVALPCTTPVLVRRASSVSQATARSDGCDEAGCSNVRASHFFAATLSRANVRVESKTAVKSDTAASAAPLTADICMHAGFPRYRPMHNCGLVQRSKLRVFLCMHVGIGCSYRICTPKGLLPGKGHTPSVKRPDSPGRETVRIVPSGRAGARLS
jgi:Protein of unknown function (DUF2934)